MAFTEALRLVIDADTRGAVQGVEKFGNVADRELSRSEKALDKWGNRLTSVGTGMITFGAAALVGLGALAKESEEANLASVKLQNTIDNMPKLAGESADQFVDLAESIQKVTAADADAIVEAESLLGTFSLTADEIKGITPLVVDYARKFGIDMADAAIQVGKALDGQVGALKRNGVSIDETLFKTDRYRAVQEALSDQVGGFAEAEGATFAGSLERMKNQLGDLAEGVGSGAVDAFSSMFGAVEKVAGALESISPGAQNLIGQVATFGAVALIAVGGLTTLVGQLIKARDTFVAAKIAATEFGITLRTVAIGGAVIGGLIAIREVLGDMADELDKLEMSKLERQLLDVADTGQVTGDVLTEVFENIAEQGDMAGQQGLQALEDLDEAFASLAAKDPEAAARAFQVISERFQEMGASSGQVKEGFDRYTEAVAAADVANRTTGAAIDEATGKIDAQTGATDAATEAVQTYSDTLKGLLDPLFGAVNAQQQLFDANNDVIGKEMELAAAIQEHGENSLEAMVATDELRQAQIDAAAAALGQEVAMDQLATAVEDGTVSVDSAKAQLQRWVEQGVITQASADATAAKFEEVGRKADELDGRNVRMTVDTIFREFHTATGRTRQMQHGGPARAHEALIVGEKRAELFIPNESGIILPYVPTQGQMTPWSGGGAGGAVALTVQVNNPIVASEREFQRMVTNAANQGLASGEINLRGRRIA